MNSTGQGIPLQLILPAAFFFLMLILAGIRVRLNKNAKEARRDAEALREQLAASASQESTLRERAVAEAIRRDPSLEGADSPEALNRLAAAAATIMEEMRLKADLERAQGARLREEQEAQAELQRQRDAEARAAAQQAREEQLAAMPPFKRLILRYPIPAAVIASVLGLVALTGISSAVNAWNERQAEARAIEAYESLKASCDPARAGEVSSQEIFIAWLGCESPSARISAMSQLGYGALGEALMDELAQDPDEKVRAALAARDDLEARQQLTLAADTSVEVQLALATNPEVEAEAFNKLAESDEQSVLEAIRDNDEAPYSAQEVAIAKLPSACISSDTDPSESLVGTKWRTTPQPSLLRGTRNPVKEYYLRHDCWVDRSVLNNNGKATATFDGREEEERWSQRGDLVTIGDFDSQYGWLVEPDYSWDKADFKVVYRMQDGRLVDTYESDLTTDYDVLVPAGKGPDANR